MKISECISTIIDNRGKTPDLVEIGIPLIEAKTFSIQTAYVDVEKCEKFVSEELYETWFRGGHPIKNDLLVTLVGALGNLTLMTNDKACIAQNIVALRFKKDINPIFIYYLLRTDYYQKKIHALNRSSVQPSINVNDFLDLDIELPSKQVQDKISNFLISIDLKISNNNKIIDLLNLNLKEIFNFWFLQFNFPNQEGKPYKLSNGSMKFDKNLKIKIPKGWKIETLHDKIDFLRGVSYSSEQLCKFSNFPMINLDSINRECNYKPNCLKYLNEPPDDDKKCKADDLLIACTDLTKNADIIGCPIFVPTTNFEFTFSSDLAKVKILDNSITKDYLYQCLRTKFYHKYIKGFASGTNVIHLNLQGIKEYMIVIPDYQIQSKFEKISIAVRSYCNNLILENQQLCCFRDFVLPQLIYKKAKII